MKLIAPDYYNAFRCIASRCRHSCCIGWEIDIDEDTLEIYDGVKGSFGERLNTSIERTDEGAHFRLGEGERCPFLNDAGLCDLIMEMGEDSLCQICADHPRFRNFFSDRTEIGLGLCCEAAGRIILSKKKKTSLVILEDDGEAEEMWEDETDILEMRRAAMDILQNRGRNLDERLDDMMDFCGVKAPMPSWAELADRFTKLERLDAAWEEYIRMLAVEEEPETLSGPEWEAAFEQLAVYFLYRHFAGAVEDGDIAGRAGFVVLGVRAIRRICQVCASMRETFGMDDLVEIARMYSSEIEYSDENMDVLTSLFREPAE